MVSGDLRDDPEELVRFMEGCPGLVHSGALVYPDVSWPRLRTRASVGNRALTPALARVAHLATRGNPSSTDELRGRLGWQPRYGSVEGLERTGRWIAARDVGRRSHTQEEIDQGEIDERR